MGQLHDEQIFVLTDVEVPVVDQNESGAKFGGNRHKVENVSEQVVVSMSSDTLRDNIQQFMKNINTAFSQLPEEEKSKFHLEEIEMSVKITVEGQVLLLGSGGKVGGEGSITLRLTRK